MMNEKLEVSKVGYQCLLIKLNLLLDKKTLAKNKDFQLLCNSVMCLIPMNNQDKELQDKIHVIHEKLENMGLYN